MPNQNNYKQNIGTITIGDDIFRLGEEDSILFTATTSNGFLGLDLEREFIELHFYIQGKDTLIKSAVIPLSDGYLTIVDDADPNNLVLRLRFWATNETTPPNVPTETLQEKYLGDLQPGTYDLIINFFADELGSYHNKSWKISEISPTRQEIVITRAPHQRIDLIRFSQFLHTSMFVDDFQNFMLENFNINGVQYEDYRKDFVDSLNNLQRHASLPVFDEVTSIIENLLAIIYERLDEWVDFEIQNKRFRILQSQAYAKFSQIINDVVEEQMGTFPTLNIDNSVGVTLLTND